ncbi:hypothetical protein KEJ49_01755 [Candidatus Bathyarchaeota archaeon]|nr:hypothetical protein [Candidatus Bathyarchaeota archaeon]
MAFELLELLKGLHLETPHLALSLTLTAATAVGYRILSRSISSAGRRLELAGMIANLWTRRGCECRWNPQSLEL